MIIASENLDINEYHRAAFGAKRWFSKTTLRYFESNGAPWFKLFLDGQVTPKIPAGIEQGHALDCLLTENAKDFADRFSIKPKGHDGRTSAGKMWLLENEGKMILSENDMLILADAAAAVRNLLCWPEIEKSMAQATVRRASPALGVGLQSRPDWLHVGSGRVRDLKKTRDLAIFGRQAVTLGYEIQAAVAGWCLAGDGIQVEQSSLIAVEWERGARAREYIIPHEVLAYADRKMRALASEVADRLSRNDWIDHQQVPEILPVPDYILRQMENTP